MNISVSLTPELEAFVHEKVEGGQAADIGEVVRNALLVLKTQEDITNHDIEELRPLIARGLAQLDRGEGAPWSTEEVRAEGQRRLASKRA